MRGVVPPLPSTPSWRGYELSKRSIFLSWCLVKHRGNFYFFIRYWNSVRQWKRNSKETDGCTATPAPCDLYGHANEYSCSIFCTISPPHPERLWGTPSLLSNGYGELFSWGYNWVVREADHSPPSSANFKECVELYLQYPSTSSWHAAQLSTGTTLPFYFRISRPRPLQVIWGLAIPRWQGLTSRGKQNLCLWQ